MRPRLHRIEEEEGEGYFASVSDLMVGILFVFLLMLTVFALNFHQAERDQDIARREYEAKVAELARQKEATAAAESEAQRQRQAAETQAEVNRRLRENLRQALRLLEEELRAREQARQGLLARLQDELRQRGVQVIVDQQSGVLRLAGDLLFRTSSAALDPEAQRTVRVLAEALANILPCYAAKAQSDCPGGTLPVLETVLIEGHTDHQPFTSAGRYRDNDQLSTERALAVFTEVRRSQPTLDTLRNSEGLQLLGASGYGDRRPLPNAQGNTEDEFRRNRRIDIRFVLTARTSDDIQRLSRTIHEVLGEP